MSYATVRSAITAGGEYALDGAVQNLRTRQAEFDKLTKEQKVGRDRPVKPYEYGGRICCDAKTGGFYYHTVFTNRNERQILLGFSAKCKDGDRQAGWYHSHPDASGLSPQDIALSKQGFPVGETHFLRGLEGPKTTFISPASTQ